MDTIFTVTECMICTGEVRIASSDFLTESNDLREMMVENVMEYQGVCHIEVRRRTSCTQRMGVEGNYIRPFLARETSPRS